MLETEEVDIDYFTPAGSTSLASLFGKSSVADETSENTSLKYVPPPPPGKSKSEEVKPTQWIFTCAVHGFEWINSEYISKGKLGLAILKIMKTNSHSIILYDSNKATVSYVTVSPKLHIHIRDVLTISYYDNAQKYWSIRTSDEDMNKILQLLKQYEATIISKSDKETDKEQISNIKEDNKDEVVIKDEENKEEHDTDTDFYVNQRTKDSILKRMANMGHSVLPPHGSSKGCPSDSSDSSDNKSKKNIKHKPAKVPPKKDLNEEHDESNMACHSRKSINRTHNNMDGQTSVHSKSISTISCGADMNIFVSEQKISNSELRINVNRVSDKLDVVLEKLNDVITTDKTNSSSNFQNDIVQKLLKEYESKIKHYEYVMNSKGIDYNTMKLSDKNESDENVSNICKDKRGDMKNIYELEKKCKEKDDIIKKLEKEVRDVKESSIKISRDQEKIIGLEMEIKTLNDNLNLKNQEMDSVLKNLSNTNESNKESCDTVNKIKKIMNDTFDAISVNFQDDEEYFGERIKALIAVVIKKTTIKALEEL